MTYWSRLLELITSWLSTLYRPALNSIAAWLPISHSSIEDDKVDLVVGFATYAQSHLPLPVHPTTSPQRVPYCCSRKYDGAGFLTFPTRAGWPQILPSAEQPNFFMYDMQHPALDRALEDFLQTWLFFGLINEILGTSYQESRYVVEDKQGRFITTRYLKTDLNAWLSTVANLDKREGTVLFLHIRDCLFLAANSLGVASQPWHKDFSRSLRQTLATVCEMSCAALEEYALKQPDRTDMPLSWPKIYADAEVRSTMLANHWCISEINAIHAHGTFLSAAAFCFLENMPKPSLGRNHAICDERECRHLTTDESTYRTRHVDNCFCKKILIPLPSIETGLADGGLPLLRITGDSVDKLELTVQASSNSNNGYVALSHVWADGLGNKNSNSLPRCQLLRMRKLLQGLKGLRPWKREPGGPAVKTDQLEDRDLLLWCDALCVPVENDDNHRQTRLRNLAMDRMRTTYQNAAYVLVLDNTIEAYTLSDIGWLEGAMRIITSPWSRRLWTLQEAILAENLLFQFGDRAVDLRDIWQAHANMRNDLALERIAMDVVIWCKNVRSPFRAAEESRGSSLSTLWRLIRHRRVSFAPDEPLCIATLLGLDLSELSSVSKDRRMEVLWKMISSSEGGIPQAIIYNDLPLLGTRGFRWAPASLISDSTESGTIGPLSLDDYTRQGTLTDAGLVVQFPTWYIRRSVPSNRVSFDFRRIVTQTDDMIKIRDSRGTWHFMTYNHDNVSLNTAPILWDIVSQQAENMVLLIKYDPTDGIPSKTETYRALLAEKTAHQTITNTVSSRAHVSILEPRLDQQYPLTVAYSLAAALRQNEQLTKDLAGIGVQSCETHEQYEAGKRLFGEIVHLVHKAMSEDADLAHIGNDKELVRRLVANTVSMFVGHYFIVTEQFNDSQSWCVD